MEYQSNDRSTHSENIDSIVNNTSSDKFSLWSKYFALALQESKNTLLFKKPKNKELTKNQKLINAAISKVRVGVKHAFVSVKTLKIIRNKIRFKGNET